MCDFSRAAARQHRHDRLRRIQPISCRKLRSRSPCRDVPYQGMPGKIRRDTARAIPFLLKRENAESPHESPAYQICSPRAPCPELRAYKIDVSDALALKRSRQTQMKPRKIGEN